MGAQAVGRYREHMCGACLALGRQSGQLSRVALNHDALVLSMLVEHLTTPGDQPGGESDGRLARVGAGRCPMRGMRPATVLDPGSAAAGYAAAISLTVLHTGVSDHAADRDRGGLAARAARPVTAAWQRRVAALAPAAAPVFAAIAGCAASARLVERQPGLGFDAYVADTAAAFGHAFAGVALVAGRPEHAERLRACGAAFGTVAMVVDALDDVAADTRRGAFNLLTAAWPQATPAEVAEAAAAALQRAGDTVAGCVHQLGVADTDPVGYLLGAALLRRARRALAGYCRSHGVAVVTLRPWSAAVAGGACPTGHGRSIRQPGAPRGRSGRVGALAGLFAAAPVAALCCCDCDCGCDCCDCDCCDCDCECCDCRCCDCCDCCGDDCACGRKRRRRRRHLMAPPAAPGQW